MALHPPRIDTQDPGAHQLSDAASDDDDHFSSASEGNPNRLSTASHDSTPLTPITRVERVDDRPAHGEVPGTTAYNLRTADAVPDEMEIVPEGRRSGLSTGSRNRSRSPSRTPPATPGGTPIPRTIVERVDDKPAHGEVDGTLAKEMRMADAEPDEVRRAPVEATSGQLNGREQDPTVDSEERQEWFRSMWEGKQQDEPQDVDQQGGDGDFGDDFDQFNQGGDDDDFGDFDEAQETPIAAEHPASQKQLAPDILAGLPPLDLSGLSKSEIKDSISPYIQAIFPNSEPLADLNDLPPIDPATTSPFLSDRSLSLWQQLVSPPPMQPPNWTRSRIRRLFLVSLGVPVDLDEILPPSKQKRLALPNINLPSGTPRASTALDRLRQDGANDSTTSLDSKTGQPRPSTRPRKPRGPPPPPEFDLNAASLRCSTTEQALSVYSDAELKEHVVTLQLLKERANGALDYWLQRKDEGIKEKEALEGVIENLVGFVKGRRGG